MATDEMNQNAEAIRDYISENPGAASVSEISHELEIPADLVMFILDTYLVAEDGSIENRGTGRGGGWMPAVEEKGQESGERS
jgi:hypothetical protein